MQVQYAAVTRQQIVLSLNPGLTFTAIQQVAHHADRRSRISSRTERHRYGSLSFQRENVSTDAAVGQYADHRPGDALPGLSGTDGRRELVLAVITKVRPAK